MNPELAEWLLIFGIFLNQQRQFSFVYYAGKHVTTGEESVTLDNGGFTALELNSRTLNTKNSFLKKNGTR